jgi:2-dehydro-3-deoxyphosphogalactonate aldolase
MNLSVTIAALPLVAILRGIEPHEARDIGLALVEAGFRCLEVPLNSPDPFTSITRMKAAVGDHALVGAGTVLDVPSAQQVKQCGGEIVISPNANAAVIRETRCLDMISMPAFFTPSEAFAALEAGADALKLFPAEGASPAYLKAINAVLPRGTDVFAVGGITPTNMAPWRDAGAVGFGIGSALYRPGRTAIEVGRLAREFARAWTQG